MNYWNIIPLCWNHVWISVVALDGSRTAHLRSLCFHLGYTCSASALIVTVKKSFKIQNDRQIYTFCSFHLSKYLVWIQFPKWLSIYANITKLWRCIMISDLCVLRSHCLSFVCACVCVCIYVYICVCVCGSKGLSSSIKKPIDNQKSPPGASQGTEGDASLTKTGTVVTAVCAVLHYCMYQRVLRGMASHYLT